MTYSSPSWTSFALTVHHKMISRLEFCNHFMCLGNNNNDQNFFTCLLLIYLIPSELVPCAKFTDEGPHSLDCFGKWGNWSWDQVLWPHTPWVLAVMTQLSPAWADSNLETGSIFHAFKILWYKRTCKFQSTKSNVQKKRVTLSFWD